MSDFFRPEAKAALARWAEPLLAGAVIALGAWIALRPGGMIVTVFGYLLVLAGAVAMVPAVRRARFSRAGTATGEGAGVAQVDEGRITYMGPVTGGVIALDDLQVLSVRRDRTGGAAWVLADAEQLLVIPVAARGADALFDAFAALPGLNLERVIRAVQSRQLGSETLWRRPGGPALPRH